MPGQGIRKVRSCLASLRDGITELKVRARNVECRTRAQRGRHLPGLLGYLDRLQLPHADRALSVARRLAEVAVAALPVTSAVQPAG